MIDLPGRLLRRAGGVLALALPAAACAAPSPPACPPVLALDTRVAAPAGWEALPGPHEATLERAGFYAGHPAEGAALVPDADGRVRGGASVDLWRFAPRDGAAVWLACFYRGTAAFIATRLEPRPRQCRASYATLPSGARASLERIACD